MKALKLFGQELLAIVKNKKVLIPVIAVLIIPVLYAGMFLGAFWDPYAKLNQLPVAVVNLDKGATQDGKALHVGDELVQKLKDGKDDKESFKWEFVSEEEATKGLADRKYYIMIRIPANFSHNATTLLDKEPEKLELEYIPNESYNFLSSQIGSTGILKVKEKLSKSITETYAETMFDSIAEAGDGIGQAADGAHKIDDGVGTAKDGSTKLHDGLVELAGKFVTFQEGVNQVNAGNATVTSKLGELSTALGRIKAEGQAPLLDGASQVQAGLGQSLAGVKEINKKVPALVSGMDEVNKKMPLLIAGTDEMNKKMPLLVAGTKELNDTVAKFSKEAPAYMKKISDLNAGAGKVDAGIGALAQQLEAIIPTLPSPQKETLQATLAQLKAGSSQVADGTNQLNQMATGLGQQMPGMVEKIGQLNGGVQQVAGGIGAVNSGQKQLSSGLISIQDGQKQLAGALGTLEGAQGQLLAGQKQVTAGLGELGNKLTEAQTGANLIKDGSAKVTDGSSQLVTGANAVDNAVGQLGDGAGSLNSGLGEIKDGTSELSTKLGDASEKSGEVKGDSKKYDMFAGPVEVKDNKYTPVPNYGTGFGPYFISLGLFVGALLTSIVFPLRSSAGKPSSPISWFLSKFGVLVGIGIVQSLIVDAILIMGLGMEVQSVSKFILFSIISSICYLAIIQFFVTAFGDPGRFLAILLLIFQLTTSAGTFPLELLPNWLQGFSAWLPMTYTVAGLKAAISSGDFSYLWNCTGILLIFTAIAMLGTITALTFFFKREYSFKAEQSVEM